MFHRCNWILIPFLTQSYTLMVQVCSIIKPLYWWYWFKTVGHIFSHHQLVTVFMEELEWQCHSWHGKKQPALCSRAKAIQEQAGIGATWIWVWERGYSSQLAKAAKSWLLKRSHQACWGWHLEPAVWMQPLLHLLAALGARGISDAFGDGLNRVFSNRVSWLGHGTLKLTSCPPTV